MKKQITRLKSYLIGAILLISPFAGISHAAANGYGSFDVGSLLAYSNDQRAAAGESYLSLNGALNYAAQAKANDMVSQNYWSHYSPSGASPWSFISAAGYSYSAAGENLAYGFVSSADVISAWMNSAEHRANLLNGGFADVGFGIANSPDFMGTGPETIVVAEYGTPLYTPAPAPAYAAPSTPSSAVPATQTTVASAPAVASSDVSTPAATDTTDTQQAAPAESKPANQTQTSKAVPVKPQAKHEIKHMTWVEKLSSGELTASPVANVTHTNLPIRVSTSLTAASLAFALLGYTILPSRLR